MKKAMIIVGIFTLIVIFISVNVMHNSADSMVTVEVTTLKEETITETVITPGILTLSGQQSIYYTPEKGEIAEILVEEGENVKKGTPLLKYKNKQLELDKQQNELQLRANYLLLENIKKQHKKIDKQLEKANKDASMEREELQEEHDRISLEEKQANIEIEQTVLQKQRIEEQEKELIVVSEIEGTILQVDKNVTYETEQLEGKPLIHIATRNKFIVEGAVSEYDAMKIKEGQKVKLTTDAVQDKFWNGKVEEISFLPKNLADINLVKGDATRAQYAIIVSIDDEHMTLKPGYQMLIEIETNKEKALTVPLDAVKQEGNHTYVYIVNDGKVESREVNVGIASNDSIQITENINLDEKVVIHPSDDLQDGMEVEVK